MIRNIDIRIIPEGEQRYETLGDWWLAGSTLHVRASGDAKHDAFLIALHEMVEAYLCHVRNIPGKAVDDHDYTFEAERTEGLHGPDDEPGDDPRAPYRREHRFAMLIEHLMANELGLLDYGTVR